MSKLVTDRRAISSKTYPGTARLDMETSPGLSQQWMLMVHGLGRDLRHARYISLSIYPNFGYIMNNPLRK